MNNKKAVILELKQNQKQANRETVDLSPGISKIPADIFNNERGALAKVHAVRQSYANNTQ